MQSHEPGARQRKPDARQRKLNECLREQIIDEFESSATPTFSGTAFCIWNTNEVLEVEVEPETLEFMTSHCNFDQVRRMNLMNLTNFNLPRWPRGLRDLRWIGSPWEGYSGVAFFDSLPSNLEHLMFVTRKGYTYEEVAALIGFLSRCTNMHNASISIPMRIDSHPELMVYEWVRSTYKRNSNICQLYLEWDRLMSFTNRVILDEIEQLRDVRIANSEIRMRNDIKRRDFEQVFALLISASLAADLAREVRSFMFCFETEVPEPEF